MKKKIEINIQPVPPLPSEVIEAKKNHTLVLFIGAGVSRIDGCESWDSLSHRLLDKCYSQEIINYKEYKRLELYGAKELLTIVKGLLENAGKKNTFYSEFKRSLSGKDKKKAKTLSSEYFLFYVVPMLTFGFDSLYMKYFMESSNYWKQLKNGTTATAQPNCNGKTLAKMLHSLPPLLEQVETVRLTQELLARCDVLQKQELKRERLTKSLVQSVLRKAFEG